MDTELTGNWRTNLIVTSGVVLTVVMALLMAQLDSLQTRIQPTTLFVANVTATAEASFTPLAVAPSATPALVATATGIVDSEPTVIAVAPLCGEIPGGWTLYVVQPVDSLVSLAQSTGTTVDEIIQANCLVASAVTAGMQLFLPPRLLPVVNCGPPYWWVRYTVRPGDTMFSLARRHDTTVQAVMHANCFSTSALTAGRQIYLPPLTAVATPMPSATPRPPTATATAVPTGTSAPPATATLIPSPTATATAVATRTATAVPSATVPPAPTVTPPAPPTNTATPIRPTATDVPPPTATNTPPPPTATNTPPPPTATNTPLPPATDTPTPSSTPEPTSTMTPEPTPTPTAEPTATETPPIDGEP